MVDYYENPIVIYHSGGHVIPSKSAETSSAKKFMEEKLE